MVVGGGCVFINRLSFFLMLLLPARSTLFPSTTVLRSRPVFFFKARFQDAPSGLIKRVAGRIVTHVVGGLFIATTIPRIILFVFGTTPVTIVLRKKPSARASRKQKDRCVGGRFL